MRQVMTELVRKVPSQEWRQRMQRALTTLELYKRENLRLRQDLQQGAATSAERPGGAVRFEADRGVQDAMVAQLDEVRAKEAQLQDELRVARKARALPAGAAAGAQPCPTAPNRTAPTRPHQPAQLTRAGIAQMSASRESFLTVLEKDAKDAQARNDAQQLRLEALTAENSKLRKARRPRSKSQAEHLSRTPAPPRSKSRTEHPHSFRPRRRTRSSAPTSRARAWRASSANSSSKSSRARATRPRRWSSSCSVCTRRTPRCATRRASKESSRRRLGR